LGAFALGTDAFVISGVLPKIASDRLRRVVAVQSRHTASSDRL
jgi:predicted MFS family arabinose efflux permease